MKNIFENWNNFISEEKEVPEHFGGGENIDIFGYKTENFDICKSAVLLFEKLDSANQEETKELIREAAKPLDEMFAIEKKVVESGAASLEDVSKSADLINIFSMKIGAVSERMQEDYERETGFVKIHLEEVIKRLNEEDKEQLDERCQKGYKTHPTRKTKQMYGKTYRNCIKAEEGKTRDTYDDEVVIRNKKDRDSDRKKMGLEEKRKKKKKKKKKKDDRCTRIAKRKYDVWPSAYASGAVVKCRQGKIWKNVKENDNIGLNEEFETLLEQEDNKEFSQEERQKLKKIKKELDKASNTHKSQVDRISPMSSKDKKLKKIEKELASSSKMHKNQADRIKAIIDEEFSRYLNEKKKKKTDYSKEKKSGLHGWFSRAGGKGSKGWVDCNTCRKDKKTGRKKCKPCGRQKGEKRSKYPACRPTPSDCGTRGKGKKWGKKSAKKK